MTRTIIKKIETLLSSVYGDKIPETRPMEKIAGNAETRDQRRCKDLPFEFIRLLL